MKRITAIILVLALAVGLTGCYGGELKLYNAFTKMQDINSVEADTEVGFTFETEGFSEDEQMILEEVASVLNDAKLKIHQKQLLNDDNTKTQAEANINFKLADIDENMDIWIDMDVSEDEFKLVEILKLPEILMNTIFPEEASKEYLLYNVGAQLNTKGEKDNIKEVVEFSKNFQDKMKDFMKEFSKDFKLGKNIITAKGDKVMDGQKLEMFQLKLDDAALKELVRYAVNYTLDNEEGKEFIKDYLDAVMSIAEIPEEEKEEVEKELKEGLEEFENQIPEFKEKFDEFMDKYKNVKILGKNGIVIEYGINKNGYIAYEKGNIDLEINLADISKHMDVEDLELKGIIRLGINYESKLYNINSKDVKIEIPKLDENNSIDLFKMMETQMKALDESIEVENIEVE